MRQKIKQLFATLVILILLPYIITVFINGPSIETSAKVGDKYVKVQTASGTIKMTLDEYGIGVLAKEMSITYEEEALKAQSVLVRTSLYKKVQEEGKNVVFQDRFWTEADMEKEWGASNFAKNYKKLKAVWDHTQGQIVVYGDKPATTPFHQLSDGKTRNGKEAMGSDNYPYLLVKECPKDVEGEQAMATSSIEKAEYVIHGYDSAGYVTSITFGKKNYTGEEFRKEFALASSCFTIQEYEGKLRVTTKGVGHGLGMSQNTAKEMAKEGKTHEEILQYFFEGTEIKEVAEILLNTE